MKKVLLSILGMIFTGSVFATTSVTVTSPNGGESWLIGCPSSIQWITSTPSSVKIELYKGPLFYMTICSQTSVTAASFSWVAPWSVEPGSNYRVKITCLSSTAGGTFDFSDADFSINAGTIALTAPNGGETWQQGSTHLITWNSTVCDNLRIELWKNGVYNSLISASTPSNGTFTWVIPASTLPGNDYKVKILCATNAAGVTSTVYDFSNANFTIGSPAGITVVSPNGGEIWFTGSTYQVRWIDNIAENARIELYKGGVFNTLITASAASPFSWSIPTSLVAGNDYKIKVSGLTNTASYDFSDSDFTISQGSFITVISPNGGETRTPGCTSLIQWVSASPVSVRIDLFKGSVFYSCICSQTASSVNYFTWIPSWSIAAGNDYRVKVSCLTGSNAGAYDFSDDAFTIWPGTLSVTSPNGGESWQHGSTHQITWHSTLCDNLRIELWKNGVFHSLITASTPAAGPFAWAIPGSCPAGNDYKIKIMAVANSAGVTTTVYDFSDANFTIGNPAAGIIVVSPNGGENWCVGNSCQVKWVDNIAEYARIELWKGGVFSALITSSAISPYTWIIPTSVIPGNDYRVKVTGLSNAASSDFSDADFTISQGSFITVLSPNGGEFWARGSTHMIAWLDNIPQDVRIELWKGGAFCNLITQGTASNGSFAWAIPYTQLPG
ncbi:MAG: Ser-Thr-rich GPI-anchored membrane family protein, partial [Bacteroidota bacterium]